MTHLKTFIWTILLVATIVISAWAFIPDIVEQINSFANAKASESFSFNLFSNNISIPYIIIAKFISLALALIVVLLLIRSNRNKPTGSIILKKAKGKIEIKLASVQECLIRAARNDEDVKNAKVLFSGKGKHMTIQVQLIIWEMPDVPAKVEKLTFMLENRFTALMGPVSDDVNIDVVLKKIAARKDVQYPDEVNSSQNFEDSYADNQEASDTKGFSSDLEETVEMDK